MRPNLLNPLFGALTDPVGRRPEAREALSPPARPRRGRSARHRPALSSSDRRHRPARAPETEGRRPGHRRHRGGDRRPAPALAAATGRARPIRSTPATRPATSSSPSSTRAATISKSCCRSASSATCPAPPALYDGMLQMVHPDRVVDEAGLAQLPLVEPVYPLTEGLEPQPGAQGGRRRAAEAAGPAGMAGPALGGARALSALCRCAAGHCTGRPRPADVSPDSRAWMRLAYDELLAGQLALALVRAHLRRPAGRATPGTGALRKKLDRRPALLAHAVAVARDRRHRRRSRQARADAAAAAGRRRLGQDRGGAARRRDRDRRRTAGGADGADRNPGAAASTPPSRRSPPRPASRSRS